MRGVQCALHRCLSGERLVCVVSLDHWTNAVPSSRGIRIPFRTDVPHTPLVPNAHPPAALQVEQCSNPGAIPNVLTTFDTKADVDVSSVEGGVGRDFAPGPFTGGPRCHAL